MASKTKKLELVRKNKKSNAGKKRKANLRNNGTSKKAKDLFGDK